MHAHDRRYDCIFRLISRSCSTVNVQLLKKSETEVAHLVKEVILAEDFDRKDLGDFSVRKNMKNLDDKNILQGVRQRTFENPT